MSTFIPKKEHLREALLFCFHLKKCAAESHRMLSEAYGKHALSETCCRDWFRRFKLGDFDLQDKQRSGQPKRFSDEDLKKMVTKDQSKTIEKMSEEINGSKSTISRRLKAMGYKQKLNKWLPHQLKEADIAKRLDICQMLLSRQRKKSFLHRIITCDEKWITYENSKRKKSWVKPGQSVKSLPKRDLHGYKVMLSIFWDQRGIIYFELLDKGKKVDGHLYQQQLIRLKQVLHEKRPDYSNRHETVLLQYDNARPHTSILVKKTLEEFGWEVLPHPPYSPDIAPSDYHLFRSMQHGLSEQRFNNLLDVKKWLDDWVNSKEENFFYRGIHLLPERWENVISNDGHYFE